jgi:hypothetical protein
MRLLGLAWLIVLVGLVVAGCDNEALDQRVDAGTGPAGLSAKQAQAVLAKVGERTITLGDFVATLERMNQFDRMGYEPRERREQLLQDLIDIELLAQEAKRRGLDKRPDVQDAIRQILREAMLAKAREGLPAPAEIPAGDVQSYYEKNKDKFREPERRRVSAIVMGDEAKAKEVLAQALKIKTGEEWGTLYFEHSLDAPKEKNAGSPDDLAGDLGIVGPPGDPKGESKKVPKELQRAVFDLEKIGQIHPQVIKAEGKFYILRMSGRSEGHTRSLAEADRAIRVAILQDMIRDREKKLEEELRKRFPVEIDESALSSLELPRELPKYKPYWDKGDLPPNETAEPRREEDDD